MTRTAVLIIPAATLVAAILAGGPAAAAVIVGLVVGAVAASVAWTLQRRRLTALADEINRWMALEEHQPVRVPTGAIWQPLAVALNVLGASYDRRGRRLRRARQRRVQLVDALPEPAFLVDEDGYVLKANQAARRRFGIPQASSLTAAQALASAHVARAVQEARDIGDRVDVDVELGGSELSVVAVPVGDEVLLLLSDRGERRRVEAVRRDFVVNATHELKTPVAGIQALADALDVTVGRDPDRAGELVRRLGEEAARLAQLVHDLLDLRRLEEDSDTPGRAPVDLAALVRRETDRLRPVAGERDVAVTMDLPDRAVVTGDEDDLRLIVANLLDNAVGYNRPGGDVHVQLERSDGAWVLHVRDSGIGVARHDLDRIFERFYRVDVARSRATGGTGLGLSIVRHAVERHGGSLHVDSVLGEGSEFTVVLPTVLPT